MELLRVITYSVALRIGWEKSWKEFTWSFTHGEHKSQPWSSRWLQGVITGGERVGGCLLWQNIHNITFTISLVSVYESVAVKYIDKVVQPQPLSISRTSSPSQTETPSPLSNNSHLGSFQITSGSHPRPTEAGRLGEGPGSSIFKNSQPQCWSLNKESPTQVGFQFPNLFLATSTQWTY